MCKENIHQSRWSLRPTIATTIISGTAAQGGLNCTNLIAATGGSDGDSVAELRLNTLSSFASQLRNVTADDYLVRALKKPSFVCTFIHIPLVFVSFVFSAS